MGIDEVLERGWKIAAPGYLSLVFVDDSTHSALYTPAPSKRTLGRPRLKDKWFPLWQQAEESPDLLEGGALGLV